MCAKKSAFTLAEVLITLGIIGVVSAMTIPTLIANTNNAKFKSQYKKTLSTLNQAVKMAEAKYDQNFASLSANCPGSLPSEGDSYHTIEYSPSVCGLFQSTLSGAIDNGYFHAHNIPGTNRRYAATRNLTLGGSYLSLRHFILADNAIIAFNQNLKGCTLEVGGDLATLPAECKGFIDVNGGTLPNKEVACSDGTATVSSRVGNCVVRNNSVDMGDIFPVVYHDGTVEPATNAARYVLQQAK